MAIERFELDTEQWAVVPRVLPDYRIPLFTQICYGEHAEKLWQDFLAAAPRPEAVLQSTPDGVWEALQRVIENSAVMGPASAEDALLVAHYRDRSMFGKQPAPRPVPADCSHIWEAFPGYLIDKHEGDTISEEFLQFALADMLNDPAYNKPTRPAEPDGGAA